ncbi:MAG: RNA polymerase sigma factor [Bacteroidales bacterium]|nr:RNA polymerase sigma factor [Bacteroidales bacterium]
MKKLNKEETFNAIVSENSERIKRICRYYNSNPEDQKDMYQEVLVNIWKSLENFRGDSAISTWIYRVAVNTSLTFTGKAFKQMKLIVNSDTQNLGSIVDDENYESLQKEEQFNKLQNELNLLSVIDKALISLMLEGLMMKEIADIIGITESNVKVKLHRIKDQLKLKLKGDSHEIQ